MNNVKKAAAVLFAVLGMVLGTGMSVSAGYPPGSKPTLTLSSHQMAPGTKFTATVSQVKPNSKVQFSFNGATKSVDAKGQQITVEADGSGKAVTTFTAPAETGTYSVTAVAGTTVLNDNIQVVAETPTTAATTSTTRVPASTTPPTGSNTPVAGAAIGIPLLVGGLALLMVSRRRRPVAS